MFKTIASILNLLALLCYGIAVIVLVADLLKAAIAVLLVGQFIEFILRYIKIDLE